jgi:hypothetical protein
MVRFTSTVDVAADVERVWERITDWPTHGRFVPLTSVRITSEQSRGVGTTFVATSALGPIGFDDPMEVLEWSPPSAGGPGHCLVRKHGRLLIGWAAVDVAPLPSGRSRLSWTEELRVTPARLTRPFDRLIAAGSKFGFNRVLRSMARELEGEVRSGG